MLHGLIKPDSLVIVTVGLPRSGKTTWVLEQSQKWKCPIVSPDAVRLAIYGQYFLASAEPYVWATAQTMVPALLIAGHDLVIFDATNTTVAARRKWISPLWRTAFKVFETDVDLCIQRARTTNREDLIPIIDRMYNNWEPLLRHEERLDN